MNELSFNIIFVKSQKVRPEFDDTLIFYSIEIPALKASLSICNVDCVNIDQPKQILEKYLNRINDDLPNWLASKGNIQVCCNDYDQLYFNDWSNNKHYEFMFKNEAKNFEYQVTVTKSEIESMKDCAFKKKILKAFEDAEVLNLAEIAKARPEWNSENVSKWLAEDNYDNRVSPECLIAYFNSRNKREIGSVNAMKLIDAIATPYAYGYEPDGLIKRWGVDEEDQNKITRKLQFGSSIPSSDYEFIDFFVHCTSGSIHKLEERLHCEKSREQRFYEDLERYNKEGTFDDAYLQLADEQLDFADGKDCRLKNDIEKSKVNVDLTNMSKDEIWAMAFQAGVKNGIGRKIF